MKRDSTGGIVFPGAAGFRPRLTPKQMLASGVFGGCYFNPRGGKPGVKHPKGIPGLSVEEFPQDWTADLLEEMYASRRYNIAVNKYKVKSGQDQRAWEQQGWIHEQDPRGWFQWYCRFFTGRRTADDERQISRWSGVTGPKGRWKRTLLNKVVNSGREFDDESVSPVIRQTLLHWAYEIDAADVSKHR
eukprot:TRINITY_DN1649_c0_g1_i1.p1 TRINITY_DN1649_c0_g1~~TRINITY_DN1649_c0_g1_i1.p1  ORF type:complete len:188 (-),score=26.41 TRINITY_DN1649_c0_g1_i1:141-704(-)